MELGNRLPPVASHGYFRRPRRHVISVAYGLSFAALIFAPPLSTWFAYGIAATFITTAISASIVAARSSVPFAIAGPDPPRSRSRQLW
jgi:uncharacterized ion transporter superfamily protein YfcC